MFRYGFRRKGFYVPPIIGEAIYPSYVRGKLEVLSGWDDLTGYEWIAENEQTDVFLNRFYARYYD